MKNKMIGGAAFWQRLLNVLIENDLGDSTKPSPNLYPHQWSWDSAFIAIALALIDPDRALKELETLLASQWSDGRIPHMVFDPKAKDYFPGPDLWNCRALTDAVADGPETSGMVQPPVHALAAWLIWESDRTGALRERLIALYGKLFAWHTYLMTQRDPEKLGLITIYHPWESGMDNSPRWDSALANVEVGALPPYVRRDTKHVADASERPTEPEYDRYLWLVECMKAGRYNDAEIYRTHPFLVKDAFMSAVFALSNDCLSKLAVDLDASESDRHEIQEWQKRVHDGLFKHAWNEEKGLALDLDMKQGGAQIDVSTCAGLAPILVPNGDRRIIGKTARRIFDSDFAGGSSLRFAVVPSTTPGSPGSHPRAYWRGPSWPIVNWLIWFGLLLNGFAKRAARLRRENLKLLAQPEANSGEYFELTQGIQLGSKNQSWTAAVGLIWLKHRTSPQQLLVNARRVWLDYAFRVKTFLNIPQ